MPAPLAPLAQIVRCRSGYSFTDVVQQHHAAMEHKLDLVDAADGSAGCLMLWSGANSFKAMLSAGEFSDRQRILQRRIASSYLYDVVSDPTKAAFEETGQSMSEAKAVLVVTTASAENDAAPCESKGVTGMIGQLFLKGTAYEAANTTCICHLFVDEQAMNDYLESNAPSEDAKVQRYVLPAPLPAAA